WALVSQAWEGHWSFGGNQVEREKKPFRSAATSLLRGLDTSSCERHAQPLTPYPCEMMVHADAVFKPVGPFLHGNYEGLWHPSTVTDESVRFGLTEWTGFLSATVFIDRDRSNLSNRQTEQRFSSRLAGGVPPTGSVVSTEGVRTIGASPPIW